MTESDGRMWAVPYISIHTPTQGVTSREMIESGDEHNFNPHSHTGSDCTYGCHAEASLYFNPHSHTGSDCLPMLYFTCLRISIHTPTQGVTYRDRVCDFEPSISIHTPTQGVTIFIDCSFNHTSISIHTPTQGVTKAVKHWKTW